MAGKETDLAGFGAAIEALAAPGRRLIVGLVGAPGSGKSTLAEALVERLGHGRAAVLPMDGYHYDDLYLVPAGLRPRKGSANTFDVGGLYHTLLRLRSRDEAEVAVPVFDRTIEIARAGARLIPQEVEIVVVEGNWLLLDEAPWTRLAPMFDVTAMIDVPEEVLRARLRRRWEGLGLSEPEIVAKLEENDLPNGRQMRSGSRPADFRIRNG